MVYQIYHFLKIPINLLKLLVKDEIMWVLKNGKKEDD